MGLTFVPWLRVGVAGAIKTPWGAPDARNRAEIAVGVTINGTRTVPVQKVRVFGPGDVVGLEPGQIVRTDPPAGASAHETTRFVTIEFDEPTLPWQFSPVAPGTDQRLRPWIVLVVVREQNGVSLVPAGGGRAAVLRIAPPASVKGELPDLDLSWAWAHAQVAGEVAIPELPEVLVQSPERTLSRLLCTRPLEPRTAYLACAVPAFAAGVAAGLGKPAGPDAVLAPAWRPTDAAIELPVYHSWQFRTGQGGDFLALASRLQGQPCPPTVGQMVLRVDQPGFAVAPGQAPLTLLGALCRPGASEGAGPSVELRARLSEVSATAQAEDFAAPLYAAEYTGATSVAPDATGWLPELNLDPRRRVVAGLGARVVRAEQEAMVAAAWNQVGDLAGVNRTFDGAQLARTTSGQLHTSHLTPLSPAVLLQLTSPARARIRMSPHTLAAHLEDSPLPDAAVSAAFRRLTRPRGPVMRRVLAAEEEAAIRGDAVPAPALGAADLAWHASGIEAMVRAEAEARQAAVRSGGPVAPAAATTPTPVDERLKATLLERLSPERTVPARTSARVRLPGAPPSAAASTAAAAAAMASPADPLAHRHLSPTFPTPMYSALARHAPDYVLPGAHQLPADSVVVLETNPTFVAAFLAGLNDEMGRELLWRGFPAQRGATYFQHFWDRRGYVQGQPDVQPLADWHPGAALASVATGPAGAGAVLAVRGDLLRRYPRTLIYAVRAVKGADGVRRPGDETATANIKEPRFNGFMAPDIRFFGFDVAADKLRSTATDAGWYFVLQEPPAEVRFGLRPGEALPLGGTAADVAAAAVRPTVRVLIHADDLLPLSGGA